MIKNTFGTPGSGLLKCESAHCWALFMDSPNGGKDGFDWMYLGNGDKVYLDQDRAGGFDGERNGVSQKVGDTHKTWPDWADDTFKTLQRPKKVFARPLLSTHAPPLPPAGSQCFHRTTLLKQMMTRFAGGAELAKKMSFRRVDRMTWNEARINYMTDFGKDLPNTAEAKKWLPEFGTKDPKYKNEDQKWAPTYFSLDLRHTTQARDWVHVSDKKQKLGDSHCDTKGVFPDWSESKMEGKWAEEFGPPPPPPPVPPPTLGIVKLGTGSCDASLRKLHQCKISSWYQFSSSYLQLRMRMRKAIDERRNTGGEKLGLGVRRKATSLMGWWGRRRRRRRARRRARRRRRRRRARRRRRRAGSVPRPIPARRRRRAPPPGYVFNDVKFCHKEARRHKAVGFWYAKMWYGHYCTLYYPCGTECNTEQTVGKIPGYWWQYGSKPHKVEKYNYKASGGSGECWFDKSKEDELKESCAVGLEAKDWNPKRLSPHGSCDRGLKKGVRCKISNIRIRRDAPKFDGLKSEACLTVAKKHKAMGFERHGFWGWNYCSLLYPLGARCNTASTAGKLPGYYYSWKGMNGPVDDIKVKTSGSSFWGGDCYFDAAALNTLKKSIDPEFGKPKKEGATGAAALIENFLQRDIKEEGPEFPKPSGGKSAGAHCAAAVKWRFKGSWGRKNGWACSYPPTLFALTMDIPPQGGDNPATGSNKYTFTKKVSEDWGKCARFDFGDTGSVESAKYWIAANLDHGGAGGRSKNSGTWSLNQCRRDCAMDMKCVGYNYWSKDLRIVG